uniref:CSON013021 protein n=1 Tax=Culicoides sonorensis TaxID=179676 RepID=A0A336M716_CULSO
MFRSVRLSTIFNLNIQSCKNKKTLNFSKFPKINEADLEEQFVRGSGPGGQSVNRTANNVVLKHIPTGIIVKCHKTRSLEDNRKEARRILVIRLDNEINADQSVEAQIKKIELKKLNEANRRRKILLSMKQKWKERENIE